jgi:hypothetical protein
VRNVFRPEHVCDMRIVPHGEHRELRLFAEEIKRAREDAGLIVAGVSRGCGIDRPVRSRRENGHYANPTLDPLWRYVAVVVRRLVLTT